MSDIPVSSLSRWTAGETEVQKTTSEQVKGYFFTRLVSRHLEALPWLEKRLVQTKG
jgi:hypothetical protein